ncbi:MAG: hypothetical protein LIP12_17855 [Clostridiales bacterium]|nr:hypothetical protein [Clostridiales bacterium]
MLKYGVKFYTSSGDLGSAEYNDNFYLILQLYVQDHSKNRPTLWVYDGEYYVRVHDFNYKELSPETFKKYLAERIIWSDDLLAKVDPEDYMSKREKDLQEELSQAISVGNEMLERANQIEKLGEDYKKSSEQSSEKWQYGAQLTAIADEIRRYYSRMFE